MTIDSQKQKKITELLSDVDELGIASRRSAVLAVIEVINNPDASPNEFTGLIQIDPPLTAKLLQVANSPFYAAPKTISNIEEALIWIGLDALMEILLTQRIRELFSGSKASLENTRVLLFQHSLAVALLAKTIYRREFGEKGGTVYAAGLLHDIGFLIEDQFLGHEFHQIITEASNNGKQLVKAEQDILGYDHADIGKALCFKWNFPEDLVLAIGFHHQPENVDKKYSKPAKTLYIADCLAFQHGLGFVDQELPDADLFESYTNELNLSSYALDSFVDLVKEQLQSITAKGNFLS